MGILFINSVTYGGGLPHTANIWSGLFVRAPRHTAEIQHLRVGFFPPQKMLPKT